MDLSDDDVESKNNNNNRARILNINNSNKCKLIFARGWILWDSRAEFIFVFLLYGSMLLVFGFSYLRFFVVLYRQYHLREPLPSFILSSFAFLNMIMVTIFAFSQNLYVNYLSTLVFPLDCFLIILDFLLCIYQLVGAMDLKNPNLQEFHNEFNTTINSDSFGGNLHFMEKIASVLLLLRMFRILLISSLRTKRKLFVNLTKQSLSEVGHMKMKRLQSLAKMQGTMKDAVYSGIEKQNDIATLSDSNENQTLSEKEKKVATIGELDLAIKHVYGFIDIDPLPPGLIQEKKIVTEAFENLKRSIIEKQQISSSSVKHKNQKLEEELQISGGELINFVASVHSECRKYFRRYHQMVLPLQRLNSIIDYLATEDIKSKKIKNYGIFLALLSAVKHALIAGWGWKFILLNISCLIYAGTFPATSYVFGLLTEAANNKQVDEAKLLCVAYFCLWAVQTTFMFIFGHLHADLQMVTLGSLSRRLARRILYADAFNFIPGPTASVYFSTDLIKLQTIFQSLIFQLMVPLYQITALTFVCLFRAPTLGILVIVMIIFTFAHGPRDQPKEAAKNLSKCIASAAVAFTNGANVQRMIFVSDAQEEWIDMWSQTLKPLELAMFRSYAWGSGTTAYLSQACALIVTANTILLAVLLSEGGIKLSQFVFFTNILKELILPAFTMGRLWRTVSSSSGAISRIDTVLSQPHGPEVKRKDIPPLEARLSKLYINELPLESPVVLEIENLTFTYPSAPKPCLKNVTLQFRRGEFWNVIGPSGCGKTTLLSILMAWVPIHNTDPSLASSLVESKSKNRVVRSLSKTRADSKASSTGHMTVIDENEVKLSKIRYKGIDFSKISMIDYRSQIAAVFQESLILNASIRDNIKFGCKRSNITDQDICEAADAAGCSFIYNKDIIPDGLDTLLGTNGRSLSGGQAQRICIARALCRKPKLLFLDEPTSALDAETETEFWETIRNIVSKENLTVISVTHHIESISNEQRILALKGGEHDFANSR